MTNSFHELLANYTFHLHFFFKVQYLIRGAYLILFFGTKLIKRNPYNFKFAFKIAGEIGKVSPRFGQLVGQIGNFSPHICKLVVNAPEYIPLS